MSQYKTQTHKIGVYLWIWALLFVFSFFSYMVDYLNFEGLLRWTLILAFMVSKAALIVAVFMHLFWERYAIVNCSFMANDSYVTFCWDNGCGIRIYSSHTDYFIL
jgi:cytochrome c oxidase subunit IV